MKTRASPAVVGLFVIGAVVLGGFALLSFGGINFFSKPQRFIVYFAESIHGLDLGSSVKLSGVRVGRVVGMNVRYDRSDNRSLVAVVCELSKDVLIDQRGVVIDVAERAELERLVERGLRARLQVAGLATGLLYVELDFFDPAEHPVDAELTDPRYVVVPAVPSAISEFQASATEILTNLKRVDFAGISQGVTALITDVRRQLDGVDIKAAVEQWRQTGERLEAFADGAELKRIFENLEGAVADLRTTIARLDGQIEPVGKEITDTVAEARRTIEAFGTTAEAANRFISAHSGVGSEVVDTLWQLNEAADAVKRLADFLERNPNALITGRKRP
jgi:paraquat-inducible protein B